MGFFSWLKGGEKKSESAAETSAAREADRNGANHEDEASARAAVPELAAKLQSSSGGARVDAARELLERWQAGDNEAASVLAPRIEMMLDDEEPVVRQAALAAVRLMRNPDNLNRVQSSVLARLADPMAPVRTAAVWAAAELPGEIARVQVRAQLTSNEETMRFAAARALAGKKDSTALPALEWAMDQDHLRQESLTAMMALGDAAAVPAIGELFEGERLSMFDKTMAAAALARFNDPRGAAHLIARIEDTADDRPIAAEWAGRLRIKDAAPALFALADEEGDPARGAALRALGRLQADGAWEKLRAFAEDVEGAEDLRMDAAEGLAELGTPDARELLKKLGAEDSELGQCCKDLLEELAAADARAAREAAAAAEKPGTLETPGTTADEPKTTG